MLSAPSLAADANQERRAVAKQLQGVDVDRCLQQVSLQDWFSQDAGERSHVRPLASGSLCL